MKNNIILKNRMMFCSDNLSILKNINDNSIDLIYLDPPFNKNKIFKGTSGASFNDIFIDKNQENINELFFKENFKDIFYYIDSIKNCSSKGSTNYLYYIAIRIIEMKRILKDSGNICLHSDHTMSHYIKILLDFIFGIDNFRNEIVWCYKQGGRSQRTLAKKHDIILWYSKSNNYKFNSNDIRIEYDKSSAYAKSGIKNKATGKLYKPNPNGKIPEDFWYIPALNPLDKERVGYPTQKPIKLLSRIIKMLTDENDFVLDPFCGSGTTCIASELVKRQWIGIDISKKSYENFIESIKNQSVDTKEINIEYIK